MKRKRFSEEQIIGILKEAEAGAKTKELCRKHGISDATFYIYGLLAKRKTWTSKKLLPDECVHLFGIICG
jgi:putative transposase